MVRVKRATAGQGGIRSGSGSGGPGSPEPPPYDPETGEIYDVPPAPAAVRAPVPAAPAARSGSPEIEMQRIADGALARIAAAARSPVMQGDPYREVFVALAAFVELMPVLVRSVHDARHIMPEEKITGLFRDHAAMVRQSVEKGAYDAMRKEASRIYRSVDFYTSVRTGLMVGGGFIVGALCVWGFVLFG